MYLEGPQRARPLGLLHLMAEAKEIPPSALPVERPALTNREKRRRKIALSMHERRKSLLSAIRAR